MFTSIQASLPFLLYFTKFTFPNIIDKDRAIQNFADKKRKEVIHFCKSTSLNHFDYICF